MGQPIAFTDVPAAVYRSFGFPGADDLANMFQWQEITNEAFCGRRDVAFARTLNPSLRSFGQWARENASRIPIT